MSQKKIFLRLFVITIIAALTLSTTTQAKKAYFELTIAHVNDTHGHVEPSTIPLLINGKKTTVDVGGFPAIASKIKEERTHKSNFLFLNAGDDFEGTPYFKLYHGLATEWFYNYIGLDAMTLGNHDFCCGDTVLSSYIAGAKFSIVSANVLISKNFQLRKKILPSVVKNFNGEKVGIIGLITNETPTIANPGKNFTFAPALASARQEADRLTQQGINKIIVLSHLGIEGDLELAKTVPGLDVIVGGHSHTLLGDFKKFGLKPAGKYPLVVKGPDGKKVLIVQAWEAAKLLGILKVDFDQKGNVRQFEGQPIFLTTKSLPDLVESSAFETVQVDAQAQNKLTELARPINAMQKSIVATVVEPLNRKENTGPGQLIADAFFQKTKAQGVVATLINSATARCDLLKGPLTVAKVYELLPFGNTLVVAAAKGAQIEETLNGAIDIQLGKKRKPPYFYATNLSYTFDPAKPSGQRISNIKIKNIQGEWQDIQAQQTYKIAVNSFMAQGSDGYNALKKTLQTNTDFVDADVMMEYLKKMGSVKNP